MASGPRTQPWEPQESKPQKRLQKLATGKAGREGPRQGGSNVLQRWLQKEKEGFEALKTGLGPKKAKGSRYKVDGE